MPTLGQVTLNDGSFHAPYESLNDHEQMPQFLPRTQWPLEENSLASAKAKINTDIDWNDDQQVSQLHASISNPGSQPGAYQHLRPMQPFDNLHLEYGDVSWYTHVAILHTFLHRTLAASRHVSVAEMRAMLRVVSYGIHKSTTFFQPWQVVGVPKIVPERLAPDKFEEAWNPCFDMATKIGRFVDGHDIRGTNYCKIRVWSRRFVVVPVIHGRYQWSMTIFDRFQRQLYIFDCGNAEYKRERVSACVHFWIEFWNALGMAYTFSYFVPDVMKQPAVEESGLLCIVWLMNSLRNGVGKQMSAQDPGAVRLDIDVCEPTQRLPMVSSLYLRDWAPDGCRALSRALMAVRRILRVMVCNELGLRTHQVMTKEYANPAGDPFPSAWSRLSVIILALRDHDREITSIPSSGFWTGNGGPCFALPMATEVAPYNVHQERRHHPPSDETMSPIETRPYFLYKPYLQSLEWPAGMVYTPEHPIRRPLPAIHLAANDLRLWANLEQGKHFKINLVNELARRGYEDLEQSMDIIIDSIDIVDDQAGDFLLRCILIVGVDGGRFVRHPVAYAVRR